MPRISFDQMPPDARLWVFAASRTLDPDESQSLLETTDAFLDQWVAHGQPLTAARDWRHRRFLLVAVDERRAGVSGCSIDALVRGLRDLESRLRVQLIDNAPVLYRTGTEIHRVSRADFSELAQTRQVSPETIVFDNTVATVGALRDGRWEVPAMESWHGAAFFPLSH